MADSKKESNQFASLLGLVSGLIPGAGRLASKSYQDSLVEAVGSVVGPIGDILQSNKPIGEKALRLGGMVAENVASVPAQLLAYSPEAKAAIRPGGAPDLNMFHATSVDKLLSLLQQGVRKFTAPSIAITSNRGNPFARSSQANLVMNPNYKGFDPATSKSQLFNRDAYVDTSKSEQRLGLGGEDMRLSQEFSLALPHALSILFSPRATSFENFEKSVLGANVIRDFTPEKATAKRSSAKDAISQVLTQLGHKGENLVGQEFSPEGAREVADLLRTVSKVEGRTGRYARDAIAKSALAPADYAELKMVEDLPLSSETLSAVFLPARHARDKNITDELKRLLPNVPIGTPAELLPADATQLYRDIATELTKQSQKTSKIPVSDYLKDDYILGGDYPSGLEYEDVMSAVVNSEKFTSDVASMLTAGKKPAGFVETPVTEPKYNPAAAWDFLKEIK